MSNEHQASIHDQCDWAAIKLAELGIPHARRSQDGETFSSVVSRVNWEVPICRTALKSVTYQELVTFYDDGTFKVEEGDDSGYSQYFKDKVKLVRSVLLTSYKRVQVLYHMRDDVPGFHIVDQMAFEIQREIDKKLLADMLTFATSGSK